MATIKSFSDLEQSKKLAEILPLESADMTYRAVVEGARDKTTIKGWEIVTGTKKWEVSVNAIKNNSFSYRNGYIVPCWSLAALLGVMSQINEWFTPYGHKNEILYQFEPKICKIWEHNTIPSYKVTYGNRLFTDSYDNPVDACVAMVEKLHELNLL